jgi:CTP:molybdopterin cytidylyltransferase MocA
MKLKSQKGDVGLAGLILAGGEGKRWGGPKAFATLPDGRSFLEACSATLNAAGASPVVATLPPESADPKIEGLLPCPLPRPGLDMFASLRIGLALLVELSPWKVLAVHPVDHPLVAVKSVATLAAIEALATIPRYRGKHGHPVCLRRSVAEGIVDQALPGPTLRDSLRAINAFDVVVEDPGTIAHCNTPEALAKALENLPSRPGYA